MPSLNEDDDAILAIDSPVLAQIENSAKNSANRVCCSVTYRLSCNNFFDVFQLCSDDELILAVDSPLFNKRPSIQVTDTDARPDFPTEVKIFKRLLLRVDSFMNCFGSSSFTPTFSVSRYLLYLEYSRQPDLDSTKQPGSIFVCQIRSKIYPV